MNWKGTPASLNATANKVNEGEGANAISSPPLVCSSASYRKGACDNLRAR